MINSVSNTAKILKGKSGFEEDERVQNNLLFPPIYPIMLLDLPKHFPKDFLPPTTSNAPWKFLIANKLCREKESQAK
jgi:hypothetical protein